jgi:hypothetical protein
MTDSAEDLPVAMHAFAAGAEPRYLGRRPRAVRGGKTIAFDDFEATCAECSARFKLSLGVGASKKTPPPRKLCRDCTALAGRRATRQRYQENAKRRATIAKIKSALGVTQVEGQMFDARLTAPTALEPPRRPGKPARADMSPEALAEVRARERHLDAKRHRRPVRERKAEWQAALERLRATELRGRLLVLLGIADKAEAAKIEREARVDAALGDLL